MYIAAGAFKEMVPIYITAFLLGPCVCGRMACGFLLLIEMVPKKNQAWVGAAVMIAEGFCGIIWTAYFVLISRNAFYFIWFCVALTVIALVGTLYIVESPRYLYGMEKYNECRQAMISIAFRNGVTDYEEPLFEEEQILMVEDVESDLIERINPSGPELGGGN